MNLHVFVFALAAILFFQPSLNILDAFATANEIFVDVSGACEGKTPCFTSIQAALNSASKGDIVRVYPGTYTEQIRIPVSLTLISTHGAESTAIEAPVADSRATATHTFPFGSRTVDYLILVDNVHGATVIDGFTIDGKRDGMPERTYAGIYVVDSDEVAIKDNIIKGLRYAQCEQCSDGAGIIVRSGAEETLPENSRISSVIVEHNLIIDYQKAGIVINEHGSTAKLIKDNTIIGSGISSVVAQNGIQVGFGAFVEPEKLIQNTISGNYHEAEGQNIKLAIGILILHADGTAAEDRTILEKNNVAYDNQVACAVIP